jgi:succinylglutamic semialdehyde dehydrogenase
VLTGNAVVFKPSEYTPATGVHLTRLWQEAGLPPDVLQLVHGGGEVGAALVREPGHDGVLLTGSLKAGLALRQALVDQPQKMLALEMGGNNPLVVHQVADAQAAALLTIQSAFITAGQRCTCARRLIVPEGEAGDRYIEALVTMMQRLRLGAPTAEPEPFIGPLIDQAAADAILTIADRLHQAGGRYLVKPERDEAGPAFVRPGVIDISRAEDVPDVESFGPLLQLKRVPDFDAAVEQANNTAFGLVAGLLSDHRALYEHFYQHARAGLINWNKPTTGASSRLPFGGVGLSGNYRPSGAFAVDYCTYPVASLEEPQLTMPATWPRGFST